MTMYTLQCPKRFLGLFPVYAINISVCLSKYIIDHVELRCANRGRYAISLPRANPKVG
jgi:hypothetical protein